MVRPYKVRFDTQRMQNAEITRVQYQQGELAGYEVREYLLEKWGRKCVYCNGRNTPLQIEYVKVKGEASPYDGNLVYWSSRMGKHPEMPLRAASLLKKQKGKCAHCGLWFSEEDVIELDHIIPKAIGGKRVFIISFNRTINM